MRRFACIVFAALLAALAIPAFAAGDKAPADAPIRWAHPALWKIVNGTTTVYLFGSVHIIPGNIAWADNEIDSAIRAADVFYFEASLDARALLDISDVVRTKGMLQGGKTLRSLLSRKGLANYNALMAQLGSPPQQLDRFRPWLAMMLLSMRHSSLRAITAPGSVDPAVMSYAQSHGKEMRYFETARQQMGIFSDLDEASEVAVFESSIAQFNERADRTTALIDAWARGESDPLADMLAETFVAIPAARRALVDDRNRDFATAIQQLLHEPNKTVLVTIGAGHYGGRTGVIALLCAADVHVVQIGRNGSPATPACGRTRGSLSR